MKNNYYFNIGYTLFGPLVYNFCKFIKQNTLTNEKLLFVSREGEFIKKCFDIMYNESNSDILFVSRQSIIKSMAYKYLQTYPFSSFLEIIGTTRNETNKTMLTKLGLDSKKYSKEIDLNQALSLKQIEKFFQKNENKILNDLKPNSELFSKYITKTLNSNCILVDIGWKGTMQNLLTKYTEINNINVNIRGLYLGIMDSKDKKGFLFNSNDKKCQQILNFSGLLELIMMPSHGTVIGYIEDNNNSIIPRFYNSEFTSNSLKILKQIQDGIIYYINTPTNLYSIDKIFKMINKFGNQPGWKDIKYFKNLEFYDNGKIYRLIEPIKISSIKDDFINSKWKSAFMKQLFKIKLPYSHLLVFMRRKDDKKWKKLVL